MKRICFQCAYWYNAITLSERLASLHALGHRISMSKIDLNTDLAEQRLQRWRSQSPFAIDSYFDQRLAIDGMSEDELRYLLGEPVVAVHDRFPASPAWLSDLAQAFSCPHSSDPHSLSVEKSSHELAGFLDAIGPLIRQGRDRLQEGLQALIQARNEMPFDPATIEGVLFANLPGHLLVIMGRTMVLELNVARLQGVLGGNTAEERFRSFLQHVRQPDTALAFLQEYPVLARQLTIRIDHWIRFSLEFLQNLCADWQTIQTILSSENDLGRLVQVDGGVGDTHRSGRSVLIAKFSSGLQVVYKPKSLAVDVHFQELLKWLNDRGNHPPFRTLKIIDRGSYGWTEFIAAQRCSSVAEIQKFYERQGGYLALLYILEATDFHFENLIAAGEHPVLVDLEALFHPRVGGIELKEADEIANHLLNYSVLRVGLLPERIWSNSESEGIDISGLGAVAGQLTPFEVSQWEGVGTDEMRLIRKRVPMPENQNRPTLAATEVNTLDYTDAIVVGFTTIYQLLLKHRDDLLSSSGQLARFAQDEVRVLVRATLTYATLLHESFHPDVLRNALDRDRLFDRLWAQVERCPYLAKLIPAEREDLQKGDIPMFTTRPESRDIWSSSNNRIDGYFEQSGFELVQQRLQQLSEDDLRQQLWLINASLATLSTDVNQAPLSICSLTGLHIQADRERVLEAAREIGDRLRALALHGEHDISWIGLTQTNERHWSLVPLGTDLHDGLPGVALFFAYLGAITKETRYIALAHAALTTLRRQMERSQSFIIAIGGFTGWGGLIYALTHLSVLWEQPALLSEAEAIVERLPILIEQDERFDIVGGAAGCIGSLISLYRCTLSDNVLRAAIQCGDHLITRAQTMEHGVGWAPKWARTKPLAGFSHGAAGIAWVLLELAALTGEERFRAAALAAVAYERSLFSPEAGNWPDLRELQTSRQLANNNHSNFVTAWCHGAPGIGLGRLRSLQHIDDMAIRAEIDTALKTTLAEGFGGNHSLCHGDLGNLELLLQASEVLDDPKWPHQVNRLTAMILESIGKNGWLCGSPLGVESPGLMTGLAGIGYGLLRLAEPTRVPSVLVLEPPPLQA